MERFGGLDILVNNAGDVGRGDIEHIPVERWDTIMAVNLRAPFILMQTAIPPMRARGGGSIVNIGSILAYVGEPKLGAYSVSKGGADDADEERGVAPQPRPHPRQPDQRRLDAHRRGAAGEARAGGQGRGVDRRGDRRRVPFGRLLAPADIAYAAAYFASAESECVTGSVLDLEQYPPGAMTNT